MRLVLRHAVQSNNASALRPVDKSAAHPEKIDAFGPASSMSLKRRVARRCQMRKLCMLMRMSVS